MVELNRFRREWRRKAQAAHLENIHAFFLAAGKTDVEGALQHFLADLELIGGLDPFHEIRSGQLFLSRACAVRFTVA